MKSSIQNSWLIVACIYAMLALILVSCEKNTEELLPPEERCGNFIEQTFEMEDGNLCSAICHIGSMDTDFECNVCRVDGICPNTQATIFYYVDLKACACENVILFGSAFYNSFYESREMLCGTSDSEFGPEYIRRCGSIRLDLSIYEEGEDVWVIPGVKFKLRDKTPSIEAQKFLGDNIKRIRVEVQYYEKQD